MTIFRPLMSGVRGLRDDNPAGHLERRHQPFQYPQENAMSPDQFEQLKKYLEDMAASLATKEEYDAIVSDLKDQIATLERELEVATRPIASKVESKNDDKDGDAQ